MINILVLAFGETDRNNLLNYNLDKKLNVKTWIFDFWSKKARKDIKKLLSTKKMNGLILGGNQRIEMPRKMTRRIGYITTKRRDYSYIEEEKEYVWDILFEIIYYFRDLPILGICMGCHLLDVYYGSDAPIDMGKKFTRTREKTWLNNSILFKGMGRYGFFEYNHRQVIKNHSYNAKIIAWNKHRPSGFKFTCKHYGLNFHIIHSESDSKKILNNYVKLCEMNKYREEEYYKSGQYLTLIGILIALYSRTFDI